MQIASTRPRTAAQNQQQTQPKPQPPAENPPNRWADAYEKAKADVADAAIGYVPIMGAYENFKEGMSAGIAGQGFESDARFVGSIANAAGSLALAAGLLTGNASLTQAGCVGLSVSSVTNFIFNP